MLRLSRFVLFVLISLSLTFSFCLFSLSNPILANDTMDPKTSVKATDLTAQQPAVATPPRDYGRLPERFIVNRGQADERIQIYIEGDSKTICPANIKMLQHEGPKLQDETPLKQNVPLRPFVKGDDGKTAIVNAEANETNPDEIIAGYLATVTGPGELSFYWKVSCEPSGAYLEATLDGEQHSKISGDVDWHLKTITIPAGIHTLTWLYRKNNDCITGADCGWLNQVELTGTKAPNKS